MAAEPITWVTDGAGYQAAADRAGAGTLALLDPGDPARRARWTAVLARYGAGGVDLAAHLAQRRARATLRRAVALSDEALAPARHYAAATGALLLRRDAADLPALCRDGGPPLILVDLASRLRAPLLGALAEAPVPPAILTGADLPALTFLIAKSLLPGGATGWGGLDVLQRTVIDERGRAAPAPADLAAWLATPRRTLAINAHGEGGHVDLGDAVLCGLIGDRERGGAGPIAGGCATDCKRRAPRHALLLRPQALPAEVVYLLSCNGLALAAEGYPSSISLALAAIDGHARAFLSADRALHFEPELLAWIGRLVAAGRPPGRILAFLDDVERRRSGDRPYFLIGDPALGEAEAEAEAGDATSPPPRLADGPHPLAAEVLSELSDMPAAVVATMPPVAAIRGAARTLLWRDGADHAVQQVRAIDRTPSWRRGRDWSRSLLERCTWAAAIERVLPIGYGGLPAPFADGVAELTRCREELATNLHLLHGLLGRTARAGLWNPRIEPLQATCRAQVRRWDASFARLAAGWLLEGPVEALFLGERLPPEAGEACDRCGAGLAIYRHEPLGGGPPASACTSCPVCGIRALHRDAGPRLSVRVPDELPAGGRVALIATVTAAGADPELPGSLAVSLKDKGRGACFFTWSGAAAPTATSIPVGLPADLSPDLHTIQLLVSRGLDIAYARLRASGTTGASTDDR